MWGGGGGGMELCLHGSGLVEDYSEAKQPTQLFSSENNVSIYAL